MPGALSASSTVTLSLKLAIEIRFRTDSWLAYCPSLDLVTQAETEEGVRSALREAVDLWFESCIDRGVLDQALREAGFHKPNREEASQSSTGDFLEVQIPAYFSSSATEPRASS
jgi:predicted RNase H-like HicB family nuclease